MSTFNTFFENKSKLTVLHDSMLSFNNIRTVDVLIVEHPSFSCIEVVVYNPACIVEAPRIYINSITLQTKLKEMVITAENASQIYSRTECIVSYITSRLTVPDLPEFFLESKFCAKLIPVEDVDILRGRGENTHIDVEYLTVPDHMEIYQTYRPRLQWVTNKTNSFMYKVEAPATPLDSPHTTRAAEILGEATVEMFMDYHYNQSYLPGLMREEREKDEVTKQQHALSQALTINGSFPMQAVSGNTHMTSGTPSRPQTANTPPRIGSARPASRARTPGTTSSRSSSRRTSKVVDVVNHVKLVTTTLQRAPTLRHILEVQKALNKHSQHKKQDVSEDRHMHDIAVNCIDTYKTLFVLCTSDARGNYAAAASTVFTNTLPALTKDEVLREPNAVHKLHWIMTLWDCATDMAIYCSSDDEEEKRARSRQSNRPITAGNVFGRDPLGLAVPIPRLPPPRAAFSSSRETSDDERETDNFMFDDTVSLGSRQDDDEADDYEMHWEGGGGGSSRQGSIRNSRQGESGSRRGSSASLSNSSSLIRLDSIESRPSISVTVRKSGSSPALPPLSSTSGTPIRDYMKSEVEPQLSPPRNISTARYVTSNNSQLSASRAVQENRFQASVASPARVSSLQHHFDNLNNSINSIGALNTLTKSLEQTLLPQNSGPSRQGSTSRINSRSTSTKSVSRTPSRSNSRPTSPSGQSLASIAANSSILERREIALVGGIGSNGKVVPLPDFRYKQTAPSAPPAPRLYKQSRSTNSSPVPTLSSSNSSIASSSSKQGRSRIERATFDGNPRDQYLSGRSPIPSPRTNKNGSMSLSLPNTGRDAWNDSSEYVGIASPEKRGATDFAQAVHASNTMHRN